jgi:hypothetical protein
MKPIVILAACGITFLTGCAASWTSGSNDSASSSYDPHSMDSVNEAIEISNAANAQAATQAAVAAQQAADAQQAAQAAGQ